MGLFGQATQYLMPPSAPARKRSQRFKQRDVDEFLSEDLEVSFASTVSLNSPMKEHVSLVPDTPEKSLGYAEPMDISPAPPPKVEERKSTSRPRAHTTAARLFGSDLSNNAYPLGSSPQELPAPSIKSSVPTQSGDKRIQRSALPVEWLISGHAPEAQTEAQVEPTSIPAPTTPVDDAMDVDTSFSMAQEVAVPLSFSPVPHSAATTVTFSNLFYHSVSPRRSFESPSSYRSKKLRSVSPEPTRTVEHDISSSPGFPDSPSEAKLDRMTNGKPMLQGLGAPLFSKRPRRPILSTLVQSSLSADPVPTSDGTGNDSNNLRSAPPTRRAFSALLPPSIAREQFSEESSFEVIEESSPAQAYTKRQQVRTIRRCDGSESLRSISNASAMLAKDSPGRLMSSPYSKYMAPGLGGFGDNEAHGKVLPCHKVTEDGLMRITAGTLDDLIDGKYESYIHDYHIIDCRFDYEYNGGHIPGAVNINTTAAVEELLLGPSLTKPKPSISGDSVRKTILVFHCEFSAKRAPTFAKHLRAKDRAMNNMVYPKIHYPELYVLEGGYCAYFKRSGHRCEPPAYVTMDDPKHAIARQQDLDQFRKVKFGRHKSYAYGEAMSKGNTAPQPQVSHTKHKSVSAPPVQMFAAANAARGRRKGPLSTLVEDTGNLTMDGDDTDTDIGDSPCPPATKNGLVKSKKLTRAPLMKAETYGPSRLTLGC